MKTCFKCGETKPLGDFYKHSMMGDGHLNKCKGCTKRDVAARAAAILATPEGINAERARGRDKYHRLYKGHTVKDTEAGHRWDERNRDKKRAHNAVSNALRAGRLIRKPCEVCGEVKVEAHHDDYSKPLEVRWLCTTHHAEHHWKARAA